MTTLNATKARQDFFNLLEKVEKSSTPLTITIKGEPKVVMMSAEEFEGWVETLDVMREFPDLEKDVKQAKNEYKKGDVLTLDELLAEEGYVSIDKKKQKDVSSSNKQKGTKRA